MAAREALAISEQLPMSTSWDANEVPVEQTVEVGQMTRPGQMVSALSPQPPLLPPDPETEPELPFEVDPAPPVVPTAPPLLPPPPEAAEDVPATPPEPGRPPTVLWSQSTLQPC
jgi:hypothetical protein